MDVNFENLEEFRDSCAFPGGLPSSSSQEDEEADKTIIIQDLDHCRTHRNDHISVKDLTKDEEDPEVVLNFEDDMDVTHSPNGSSSSSSFHPPPPPPPTTTTYPQNKEEKESFNSIRLSIPFSKETEVPDLSGAKVYDFVLSKDKTLPYKLSPAEISLLRMKWIWIGGLLSLTFLVVLIVVLVLALNH